MFIPFLTRTDHSRSLFRRKGGGHGHGHSKSGGGSGKGSGSITFSFGGKTHTANNYGQGGGKPSIVPAGYPFAGRPFGGGLRIQIFGTQTYGSGYPEESERGVSEHGFPFVFWPIVWPGESGPPYLHSSDYGSPQNSSRPGGPMSIAYFRSLHTNSTLRILSDNSTVASLIKVVQTNCYSSFYASSSTFSPLPYDNNIPTPEQVVQYYRASSIALTLDGYYNTAVFEEEGVPNTPLPGNVDTTLLVCMNQTIGLAAPLVGGAGVRWDMPNLNLVVLFFVLWNIISFV